MRWQRLTTDQKNEAMRVRESTWHRMFAWRRKWDKETGTVFWLETVWRRGQGRWGYVGSPFRDYRFEYYEYRGGRECPETKKPPETK